MRLPLVALLMSATAIGVGFLVIPRPLEQITMLVRDGLFEEAVGKANAFAGAGDVRPEVLMQVFLLNERYGDRRRARAALRAYLELRPTDVAAWGLAVRAYENSQQLDSMLKALERVVALTDDPEATDRLVRLYRLHGRFEDELRVLIEREPDSLGQEHLARLAALLLGRGQVQEATTILRKVDDRAKLEGESVRLLLFDALLRQHNVDEAARRAGRWLVRDPDAYSHAVFVQYLLRAGADDAAIRLAAHAEGMADPAALSSLVYMLSGEGRHDILHRLISPWLGLADRMTEEVLNRHLRDVVNIALQFGMERELFAHLFHALDRGDRPLAQASLVDAVYDRLGYAAIAPFRAGITADVLAARPVLGARLLLVEGNRPAARHFLLHAELRSLAPQRRRDWLTTAEAILLPKELLDELIRRARMGALPPDFVPPAIDLAMRTGGHAQIHEIQATLVEKEGEPR
jgi:tetratricopeptide (TPR) repeat protein